jgi:hypothetical protein
MAVELIPEVQTLCDRYFKVKEPCKNCPVYSACVVGDVRTYDELYQYRANLNAAVLALGAV